ncbi:MAG TPA: hypothetical protein VFU42_07975 [Candidatus Deferrimicrobiaceae bacterium]|nr:hypothetical protein [Candidatus Deferrimicrobiaceae bacterium]
MEVRKVRVSLTKDLPIGDEIRVSLQSYIAKLTVPQKVELATKGNREVRLILSRDPSSIVARAVANSPRLAESDVISYAGSALTNEEILRMVAESKEWAKNNRVKVLLASNPRTPPAVAMRFLAHLPINELNLLARNRNVSMLIRREARRRVILSRK